jgi:hypothetical protein
MGDWLSLESDGGVSNSARQRDNRRLTSSGTGAAPAFSLDAVGPSIGSESLAAQQPIAGEVPQPRTAATPTAITSARATPGVRIPAGGRIGWSQQSEWTVRRNLE